MVSFYPQVMRGEGPNTPERALTWVLSILAGQLTVFALLLAAKKLWWHRAWPRRHPAVAVWSFIASIIVGVIVAGIVASPILTQAGSLSFGLEHITLGSLTLIIVGSGVIAVREHRAAVAALQQTQASLRASITNGETVLAEEREKTIRAAQAVIDEAMNSVGKPSAETVASLTSASEHVLRPLSHELAYSTDRLQITTQLTPAPRWRDVLTRVTTTPLIAPRLTAFVMLLLAWRLSVTDSSAEQPQVQANIGDSTVGVSMDLSSFGLSLLELAAVFVGTWLAAWLVATASAPILRRFGPTARWIVTVIVVLAVAALSQVLTIALFSGLGLETTIDYSLGVRLILLLPVALITAAVGLLRAVSIAQVSVREDLDQINHELEWQLARLNQRIWDQRQQLAQAVHGPVRAALISSAMELAKAEDSTNAQLIAHLTERITRASIGLTESPDDGDPLAPLSQLRQLWAGTCTINIEVDPDTRQSLIDDNITAHVVIKVIEEACANAIVHGNASTVHTQLTTDGRQLQIQVTNDGMPPDIQSRRGLGTTFLDQVALEWDLGVERSSVSLTVRLPLDVHC
jgi:signal transduction histidine kinase